MMRLMIGSVAAVFALSTVAACSGPYSGKPERLRKPKEKKRPPDAEKAAAVDDTECRTNFFDKPTKKRKTRDARRLADQADNLLVAADRTDDPAEKTNHLVEAIGKLSNALKKDPYEPTTTFKMAIAYAMSGRKNCSLALLERLATLQKHPDVEAAATRTVQRAVRDPAFSDFRKEATAALGE